MPVGLVGAGFDVNPLIIKTPHPHAVSTSSVDVPMGQK